MCYKGFLGVTPCLHNSLGLAKTLLHSKPLLYRPTLSYTSALPRVLSFMLLLGRLLCYSLLTALKSRVGLHPRPSLRPQLYVLAWLAGLLLSTLFFGRTSYRGFGWCHHQPQQPSFISPMSCLCFEGLRNPNSSGRGGRRNTPTAVKYKIYK